MQYSRRRASPAAIREAVAAGRTLGRPGGGPGGGPCAGSNGVHPATARTPSPCLYTREPGKVLKRRSAAQVDPAEAPGPAQGEPDPAAGAIRLHVPDDGTGRGD